MKQVIEGKVYNTETAEEVAEGGTWTGNFSDHHETLYRTQKGAWFLSGRGGPMSRWAEPSGNNGWRGGSGIQVLEAHEALEWLERYCDDADLIAKYFNLEEA